MSDVSIVRSKMLPNFRIPNTGKETTRSRDQHKDCTQRFDFNSDFNIHENVITLNDDEFNNKQYKLNNQF